MLNKNHMILSLTLVYTAFIPYIYAADNLEAEPNPIGDLLKITGHNTKNDFHLHKVIRYIHTHDKSVINAGPVLHTAIDEEHSSQTIQLLLTLGADNTKAGKSGHTPLDKICQKNFTVDHTIVSAFTLINGEIENSAIVEKNKSRTGSNPLHHLMRNTTIDIDTLDSLATKLIQAGYSINTRDEQGMTPTFYALTQQGAQNAKIITLLHKCAADFTIKNRAGQNPLEFASESSNAYWANHTYSEEDEVAKTCAEIANIKL